MGVIRVSKPRINNKLSTILTSKDQTSTKETDNNALIFN